MQRAVRVVFQRYAVEPSAWAVRRWARQTGFLFPTRRSSAGGDSSVAWKPLRISRRPEILKNPTEAGVYAYGRRREKHVLVDGTVRRGRHEARDPDRWLVKIENANPGYITWERYVQNQEKRYGDQISAIGRSAARPRALVPGISSGRPVSRNPGSSSSHPRSWIRCCGRCSPSYPPHRPPRRRHS